MKRKHCLYISLLSFLLLFQFGCVRNIPMTVDPSQDLRNLFPVNERIHARVGVYISEDLRNYVLNREKMGMTFKMEVGKYLVPISTQMAGAMFDEAVEVSALPPYTGSYTPNVEAVIEPEILYVYGNAAGTFSGQVEAKVKFRVKAYDLSGKVIWQGEAMGESRSDQMDYVAAFLGNLNKVGRVGYQAGLLAAQKIIRDFNASRPPELYSLLEVKALAQPTSQKKSAVLQQADKLYQKGLYHFERKNFQQALYGFQQAEKMNPDDLVFKFYTAICHMYTGQRTKAIEELKTIIARNPKGGKLTGDCRSWVQRLNDPLRVGVVFLGSDESFPAYLRSHYVQTLKGCGMYDVAEVADMQTASVLTDTSALDGYLKESSKKKVRVVVFVHAISNSRKNSDPGLSEGDIATEFELTTDVRAYGSQKRKAVSDFLLTESAARLRVQTESEKSTLQSSLAERDAARLVLLLLGNEVF